MATVPDLNLDKGMPANVDAEKTILGAILLDNSAHSEAAEKLEQLRVLEAGYPIAIGIVDEPSVGIDTPEDYRRFVERWRQSHLASQ